MKIIFLCGSLEPGKNGVGDYTRRLCGELIRQGNSCAIVAIMDKRVIKRIEEVQISEQSDIQVLRLPYSNGYRLNCHEAKPWIDAFNPDWISLQFVPFSFHPKGLPFGLGKAIQQLAHQRKLHIMFHELWVGMNEEAAFKLKLWGKLQRLTIKSLIKIANPLILHTQTKLYQFQLTQMGFKPQFLPLFSNLSLTVPIVKFQVKNEIKFAFFGGMHNNVPVNEFINALKVYIQSINGALLKFVFIGNCGSGIKEWISVLDSEKIAYEILGFCSEYKISNILVDCDYGVSTTPFNLLQKSGTVAAFLEHLLPVICVASDWTVKNFKENESTSFINIVKFEKSRPLKLGKEFKFKFEHNLNYITKTFIEQIGKY